jgi:hypothetical protein
LSAVIFSVSQLIHAHLVACARSEKNRRSLWSYLTAQLLATEAARVNASSYPTWSMVQYQGDPFLSL